MFAAFLDKPDEHERGDGGASALPCAPDGASASVGAHSENDSYFLKWQPSRLIYNSFKE
jgi:hypothetical protein